jgi:hypothetical protein
MNDDEFLAICETVWMLAQEEKALQARAARSRADRDKASSSYLSLLAAAAAEAESVRHAGDETADRIELNRLKRRLLLLRVQDMAKR